MGSVLELGLSLQRGRVPESLHVNRLGRFQFSDMLDSHPVNSVPTGLASLIVSLSHARVFVR